jgi:hypothetical protein
MGGRPASCWLARGLTALAALTLALCLGGAPAAAHAPAPAAHPCAGHGPDAAQPEGAGDRGDLHAAHCCAAVIAQAEADGGAPTSARPARPRAAAHRPGRARAPPAPPPRAV